MAPTTGTKETRSLEAILKNRPDSLLFARLADAYRKDGNISRAIELCANGLSSYPYYTTGRLLLGRCYLEQQKYSEAIEAFTMVCTGDRRNQMAIKMLADIFVKQGMEQRAGGLYALLLQMDPANKTLSHLCAKYGTNPGEDDLFTILGIEQGAAEIHRMHTGRAETPFADSLEPVPPQEVSDHTLAEDHDALFPDSNTADTMQQFSIGPKVDEQYSSTTISGGDISDRMSALFDNQQAFETPEPPARSTAPDNSQAQTFLSDALIPDTGASDSMELSGSDISDRIGQLFSDDNRPSRETVPQDFPDLSAIAETPVSDETSTGPQLTGQDFDLSGLAFGDDPQTGDTPDTAPEPFVNVSTERADSALLSAPTAPGGGDVIELVNPDAQRTMEAETTTGEGDLSGIDVSNRLEEIFSSSNADLPADTSSEVTTPAFGDDFSDQQLPEFPDFGFASPASENVSGTISEPDFDLTPDAPSADFKAINGIPDNIESDARANAFGGSATADPDLDTPASELDELAQDAAFDFSFDNSIEPPPDFGTIEILSAPAPEEVDGSRTVSGADISNRIDDLFDPAPPDFTKETSIHDAFATDNDAGGMPESFNRSTDAPDSPPDFGMHDEVAPPAPEGADGSRTVSGADISNRIDDLFDPAPPDFTKETSIHDAFATNDVAEGVPGAFDRLADASDSPRQADAFPATPSSDRLFPTQEPSELSGTAGADDQPFEPDFTESEFAETMQFDSALFEQLLNPVDQDSSPADQVPPAVVAPSETFETMPTLNDLTADDDPGLGENTATGRNPLEDTWHGRNKTDLDEVTEDTGFDRIIEPELDQDTFQVTTERYRFDGPELIVDNDVSSLLPSDGTSSLESNLSDNDIDEPPLIIEASNETGSLDISDLLTDTPISNRLVSDHTEAFETAPNGEDIAGQIDLLFPSDATAAENQGSSRLEIDIPDDLHVEDILIADSDFPPDEENDPAYIETMQMPREELAAAIARETAGVEGDENSGSDPVDYATPSNTTEDDHIDGPPVISGSDIQDRLDDIFPGSDLFSLSSDKALPPEDDQEDVMGSVSEFYTISGDDASRGTSVELPDTLAEVEFNFESDTMPSLSERAAIPPVSEVDLKGTARMETTDSTADSAGAATPKVSASPETDVMYESPSFQGNLPIDDRDEPFTIPDHVLTPTLANIYFQQGQAHLALRIYERLLRRDPDNEKLAERLADIRTAIDRNELPVPRTNEPVKIEFSRPKRTTSRASRKKPVGDDEPTARPLAGIHLKKQVKNAAKKARTRKH